MATRPAGVTLVAVLAWIEGALQILGGILLLLVSGVAGAGLPQGVIIAIGVISVVIGLVIIFVARGLLHGSSTARALVTLFSILSLVSGIYSLIQHQWGNGILTIVIAVAIIAVLWSGRAAAFFRR